MRKIVEVGVLIALAVAGSGLVHVVTYNDSLPSLCLKEHWSLRDTFVDGDRLRERFARFLAKEIRFELRNRSMSPIGQHEMDVMTAMMRCGVLRNPLDD